MLEKSHMIDRNIDKIIENHYANSKSALLLTGARQVGKTIAFRRYAEKMGMELVGMIKKRKEDAVELL